MNSAVPNLIPGPTLPNTDKKSVGPLVHALYVGILILYVLAGCRLVPLHGDESTILYMSADFSTLFLRGDLAHLEYHNPPSTDDPEAATKQALRIANGVTSKYLYGLSWWLAGFQSSSLNQQWIWGADYTYNQAQNAIPNPVLLFVTRWSSGLMTAISVVLIFVIGRRIGGWQTAYVAAFIYALTPAILLNGRRANFESTLMVFSALLIYLMLRWLNKSLNFRQILMLGIAAGLTIASKHTGVITVMIAFGTLITVPLLRQRWSQTAQTVLAIIAAGIVTASIFFVLNVSWWGTPLAMPSVVLQIRQMLLNEQVAAFGGFHSPINRITTLIGQSLLAAPQYFEVPQGWPDWIGGQIVQYESAKLAGLYGARWTFLAGLLAVGGLLRIVLVLLRLIRPVSRDIVRAAPLIAMILWFGLTVIIMYALTPLDWQRYYLSLVAPVAVLCGMAVMKAPRPMGSPICDQVAKPA